MNQTLWSVIYSLLLHSLSFSTSSSTFTMDVNSEAKSEPSQSWNSEAMSEPSWSIMVETRARAKLGKGTLFFFFFLKIKKSYCF